MSVILPAPPSANQMYKIVSRKLVKTHRYVLWCNSVGYLLRARFREMPHKTPLRVEIRAAVSRRRDIDNLIKPTLDALQACGVIKDDRWVDSIVMNRVTDSGRLADGEVELFVGLLN